MAQRVIALRDEVKEKDERIAQLEADYNQCRETLGNTSQELEVTKQILMSTDHSLRDLTGKHQELTAEQQETARQLHSSTTHGETLEAQVSVFRRGKELEHDQDRLFAYFLKHCLCPSCLPEAERYGAVAHVPGVADKRATTEIGILASETENAMHCAERGSNPIKLADQSLRVPHEVSALVNKNFEELSVRADSQRSQIHSLQDALRHRDAEILRLNDNCKAFQAALDTIREHHRATENNLMLESAEKAAAEVRRDDAVRMTHLLKAALRQALEEKDKIARELDKQLTRIQVIDANEAMHKNRHDDAARSIDARTNEIVQLRAVVATMQSNHDSLLTENRQLRAAANTLQDQIANMKQRFDTLSYDVQRRLEEQALRVTQIEDHTMKLATTAVQAQMAEQEASKAAQRLIEQMRNSSTETQQVTKLAVNEVHQVPLVLLPAQARTVTPAFVASSLPAPDEEENSNNNNNNGGHKSPMRGDTQPRHGPASPAGRLGAALAEASAYGSASGHHDTGASHRLDTLHVAATIAAQESAAAAGGGAAAADLTTVDDRKMQELLTPFRPPGSVVQVAKPLDPAEKLAAQIRATLAEDAAARESLERAMVHANETIGHQ